MIKEHFFKAATKEREYFRKKGRFEKTFILIRQSPLKYLLFRLSKLGIVKNVTCSLFFGKKIKVDLRDSEVFFLYFFGKLSRTEDNLILFFIENIEKYDSFYDIGANHGFYSLLAAHLKNEMSIYAFEPNLDTTHNLLKEADIKLVNSAVSNDDGSMDLYGSKLIGSGKSTLLPETLSPEKKQFVEKMSVPTVRLDTFVKTNTVPDLIKIDVEGAELHVLKGASALLKEHSIDIIMEVWGGKKGITFSGESIKFLKNLGYTSYKIDHRGYIEISPINLSTMETSLDNYLFRLE
jgi:FkbM family methyltransferase